MFRRNPGAVGKALRSTGMNVLGEVPWGSHVCVFYESSVDLLDTVIPFFKTGLETMQDAQSALRRGIPDFDQHLEAGRLEIVAGRDWYLQRGQIDLRRVIAAREAKMRGALAKGFDGLRVSGDTFWLNSDHWDAF